MRDKLAAIPLFEGVDAASLDRLLAFPGVEERRFERGEIVSPRGAPGGELLIFWEGRVAVNKNGLRLRELTKGDLSGVATLFSDAVTDTELTALTRVRLLRIPEEALDAFLKEYKESIEYANAHPAETGVLCEKYEIVLSAAVAETAIPNCHIAFLEGAEMKTELSAFLGVLYGYKAQIVGGKLPDDAFYYAK